MSDTTNENPAASQVSGEESFEPKVVNEFEVAPRGEARIAGIDIAAIDARLDECADFFSKHCDETDYRNLGIFSGRNCDSRRATIFLKSLTICLWRRDASMNAMPCTWN